jgi:ABC-type transporter Mla MlaB component
MKPTHVKIWPEVLNYQPAIIPFNKENDNQKNSIIIDFTNCKAVDSSGLTLLLIDLIKLFKKSPKRKWSLIIENNALKEDLKQLGFFNIINRYSGDYELSIDTPFDESLINAKQKWIKKKFAEIETYSFPIYHIDFNLFTARRDPLERLRKDISKIIKKLFVGFGLKAHFFLAIIQEIAKNSADHTSDNAFLGLDISINTAQTYLKVQFSYGDLDKGIHNSIKEFVVRKEPKKKVDKWGLSDSYYYALNNGFTTKPESSHNKGIGMTLILEACEALNIDISVFDANSRAVLSKVKDNSHAEIRKALYDTGRSVGFYYYGELIAHKM